MLHTPKKKPDIEQNVKPITMLVEVQWSSGSVSDYKSKGRGLESQLCLVI